MHAGACARRGEGGPGGIRPRRAGVGGNRRLTLGARAERSEVRSVRPANGGGRCPTNRAGAPAPVMVG